MVRLLALARGGAAALAAASAGQAFAAGDAGRGHAVFATQCSICHSSNKGGGVVLGPPLYGVVGRKAGSVAGFSYSGAMKNAGFTWDSAHLHAYLPAPRTYLPGVRMTYPGLKDPAQLDDLVAYLQSLR